MKKTKSYLRVAVGALIIGITLNLFFVEKELIPAGTLGFSMLYTSKVNLDLSLTILLANIFFLSLGLLVLPKKYIKSAILPFLLVPLFTFLTKDIIKFVNLSGADFILISIFGGALIGIGHKYIYRENCLASGADIITLIGEASFGDDSHIINYILDVIWFIFATILFGFEQSLYSAIAIVIIEILCKRTKVGVSDAKVFYIITNEEQKVKKFIMDELNYDLTIFDVKGGYSKNKNRVLMSAIPTKDYYKLREGIKEIDPNAFISITDSYELVNENNSINAK